MLMAGAVFEPVPRHLPYYEKMDAGFPEQILAGVRKRQVVRFRDYGLDKARESCPVWPGQPVIAHWGADDPAAFVGSPEATERFFYDVALILHRRMQLLTSRP